VPVSEVPYATVDAVSRRRARPGDFDRPLWTAARADGRVGARRRWSGRLRCAPSWTNSVRSTR